MNSAKRERTSNFWGSLQALLVFMIMFLALSLFVPAFFSWRNIFNLMKQLSANLVIASGMTMVILTGEFDISVGSVMGLCMFAGILLMNQYGIFVGFLLSLAIGVTCGFINGVITTKGKVPSFITTLGMQMIARGVTYVISSGYNIKLQDDRFAVLGQAATLGIPNLFWVVILVYIVIFILLKQTRFGQYIYAVGSNRQAAVLSGINADRVKIKTFMLLGLLVGLTAMLNGSRMMSAHPDSGTGLEFEVIAAVVIGGTSVSGGEGSVLMSIIGVFIIGFIRNALNLTHVNILWNHVVTGSVILTAVLLDSLRKGLQKRLAQRALLRGQ